MDAYALNSYYEKLETVYRYNSEPDVIHDYPYIQPDLWPAGGYRILESDEIDKTYFGQDVLRIATYQELIPTLAIKIKVTGRGERFIYRNSWGIRVKIEFLRDGEPSEFTGGWLYRPLGR